jgi:predicted metal-dependent hydrolase
MRQKKEIKRIQIGKEEVKLSLFANDLISYLKDPKNVTKIFLRLHKQFHQSSRIQSQYTTISIKNQEKNPGKQFHSQ